MLRITCPVCNGQAASCERCSGTGVADVFRCPSSHNSGELSQAFFAYMLVESGVWPADGGLCDQAAWFVAFVQAVGAERAAIERDRDEREKRKAR